MMKTAHTTWRLILTPPAPGAWNMAADEAILEAARGGNVPPTLRLYAWDPPCLSLGYAQPATDIDFDRLGAAGWHAVRRPTGGRAILHTDELTYSISGPMSEPILSGGVLDSYRRISLALLDALKRLGVQASADAQPAGPSEAASKGPVCFEVPSNYEITAGGKKLVGSAQARRQDGVLQHGSLPLAGDLSRITRVLNYSSEEPRAAAAAKVLNRAVTLETLLGATVSWDQVARAYIEAFTETLDIELTPAELTAAEIERAAELVSEKYASSDWLKKL